MVVAFSKQRAKADPMDIMSPKTPKVPKVPQKKALALDTGNYELLGSSQIDYSIQVCQERETGELTFRLPPEARTQSVPNAKRVVARSLAAQQDIGIAYVSAICSLNDHTGYTKLRYAIASPSVPTMIHAHQLPMLNNGGSDICRMSERSPES